MLPTREQARAGQPAGTQMTAQVSGHLPVRIRHKHLVRRALALLADPLAIEVGGAVGSEARVP